MSTTDDNGIVLLQQTDPLEPLDATINLVSASISEAFDAQVRPYIVPNLAGRNALQGSNTPTKENPLLVWRQDLGKFEMNSGAGWKTWPAEGPVTASGVWEPNQRLSPGQFLGRTINFGRTFAEPPKVHVTPYGYYCNVSVVNSTITKNSFYVRICNVGPTIQEANYVGLSWDAVGMPE